MLLSSFAIVRSSALSVLSAVALYISIIVIDLRYIEIVRLRRITTESPKNIKPSNYFPFTTLSKTIKAMDRKTRDKFHGISAKEWKDLGYDEIPRPCNLSGKINPIFANYHKKDRGFIGTDEEYTLIMPALQVASNYLYSPKSCRFLYSIVYGDRKPVSGNVKEGGLTINIIGRLGLKLIPGTCTELSRIDEKSYCPKKMEHIWNKLARHNHFSAEESDNDGETCLRLQDGK